MWSLIKNPGYKLQSEMAEPVLQHKNHLDFVILTPQILNQSINQIQRKSHAPEEFIEESEDLLNRDKAGDLFFLSFHVSQ